MFRIILFLTLSLVLFPLVSCATTSSQIAPDWTESMFFKHAQDAMSINSFKQALFYYEVYLVRFPENHSKGIAAEYSIAFIKYKMGDYKKAEADYEAILSKYETSPYAMLYHPRFRILAEQGLMSIKKQKFTKNKLFWRSREQKWAKENETLPEREYPQSF